MAEGWAQGWVEVWVGGSPLCWPWAVSPACVSAKEAGRLVPKGRDCRLNARAGCWHQQPQDVITQAARDTHDLVFGSADCGHA